MGILWRPRGLSPPTLDTSRELFKIQSKYALVIAAICGKMRFKINKPAMLLRWPEFIT